MRLNRSQQEIVKILRRRGSATVEDLSRAIGITPVAVRQHLDALESSGLIDSQPERRPKGRPRHLYQLTEAADELFPKNYSGLAQMILEHLEQTGGPEEVESVFAARRRRMEEHLTPRLDELDLAGRVAAVAEMQDRAGYMAEWRQEEDGSFLLREHNCPICLVARRFPQPCANELRMIENLTGAEVEREKCMVSGDPICSYRIRLPLVGKDRGKER